jgi:hypothetical protein
MSERGESPDAARTLRGDWARMRDEVLDATDDARSFVGDQVEAHPLVAVGAAAGVGFLLGGGANRHSLALLLGLGARMAASFVGDELADAFDRGPQERTRDDRTPRGGPAPREG